MSSSRNNGLQQTKNKKILYLFFVTFFFSMVVVGFIIKTISPSVDVEIGDNVNDPQETIEQNEWQGGIDNRLKWIQFEDNMPGVSRRMDEAQPISDDENLQGEEQKVAEEKVTDSKDKAKTDSKAKKLAPPVPTVADAVENVNASSAPLKMTKVYVGYYSSIDQAISAQNRLLDSNLSVSPFVKEVNGYYVVQVGSYANKQKAQNLYSEVSSMGFPARMTIE